LCRNRKCVNPEHLEPVTPRINVLRGDTFARANNAKTHCPKGHELAGENLDSYALGVGSRACRECSRERWRAYWHTKLKPARLEKYGQTMKPENRARAVKQHRKRSLP